MPKRRKLSLLVVPAGVAAWTATVRADRRRLLADPERASFAAPIGGGRTVSARGRDGTELHAEVFGPEDAPTIVLLHGWTESTRLWINQIQDLSADHRVVAVELRGHGHSGRSPRGDYSIEAFADDFEAVLERCVPRGRPAVVVGHSLGGMTIVAWAARHTAQVSARVSAAVLINTGMGDLISETLLLRAPPAFAEAKRVLAEVLLAAAVPLPLTPFTNRAIRWIVFGSEPSPARVELFTSMVLDVPPDVRGAVGSSLGRLAQHDAIASLKVPTVVIAGALDRLTPPVHSLRLAQELPQLVEYVPLPGVGHAAPIEQPAAVTARIRRLTRAVQSSPPALHLVA